jgi:putative endonuclease
MTAWIYITTNKREGVLYTGVTSELKYRITSHKTKKYKNSFSARYNLDKLVYFEKFDSIITAREREKQLKAGSRAKKIKLIESINPEWEDLFETLE